MEKSQKAKTFGATALGRKINWSATGSLLGLIAIFILAIILTGGRTLGSANVQNLMRQVTILGIASLGMCMVILTSNIDLSVIGNVTLANVTTAVLMQNEVPLILVIAIVCLVCSFVGLINAILLSVWKVESFIITMGMQVVCFGSAAWVAGNTTVIVDSALLEGQYMFMRNLATTTWFGVPAMFVFMLFLYAIFWVFTSKTKIGRYVLALGGSEEVCYMSGVNVNVIRSVAYVLSGFCAGIAGIFMYSRSLAGDPTAGNSLGMFVVAAVVVGGTKMSGGRGSVLFTIIGIFIIQIITNTLNLVRAPYEVQQVIQGVIILIAVIMSSEKRR